MIFRRKPTTFGINKTRPMKLKTMNPQSVWKLALKVSAVGVSIVLATYTLVWLLLSILRLFVEGIYA